MTRTLRKKVYEKSIRKKYTKKVYEKTLVIPSRDKDIVATIDIKAVKHNLSVLRSNAKTDIMPVLKADAYGHGLIDMAKKLRKMNVKHIGVATLGEAILLRESGDKGRVLAWLFDIDGSEIKDAMHMDLDIAICDETIIPKFIKLIPAGKKIKVTLFVDTGINRAGINYDKAFETFIEISKCEKIELVGMMSHLVCSQIKNSPIVNEQLRKFRELRKRLADVNIIPPLVHIANTTACLNYDVSDFTLSRSGRGIHGLLNDKPYKKFKLTMTVTSYIIQLKDIDKEQGIGYDWKYITPRKMRVCIIPIGYADIIPKNASNKMYVYINGTKRKVLGSISMDQIVVEAKEKDKLNDVVYIFGNGKNCPQTIYDIARQTDTMAPEILCHTGYRVNRRYI
jgi:alanine racemase